MHEASMHKSNMFLTLTYKDECLPPGNSLKYEDFQLFMKRYRKEHNGRIKASGAETEGISFYMCGEYGENFGRPHFHACIFGDRFPDLVLWRRSGSGELIYRSETLERLWPFGYSSVGDVNFRSAAYVARYVMKKVTGDLADVKFGDVRSDGALVARSHYEYVDDDGVIHERVPEFNRMSLKPAIGKRWFDKWSSDVYPSDNVIVNGKQCKPPKYYDRLLERIDEAQFIEIKDRREFDAQAFRGDNTPQRLEAKEAVTGAKLSRLKRGLV